MLVVGRKRGESIVIGHDIEVHVLRVGRDGVRLGIVAPADVPVHRTEIYDLVRRENESAAALPVGALGHVNRFRFGSAR